jgi:hypothetical protein
MRRAIFIATFCSSITVLCGCTSAPVGHGVVVGTPSTVTVTPSSAALKLGANQQFTADVVGSSDQSVQWEVNGVPGGNTSFGLISEGGVYLAPTLLPASPTIIITAAAFADPSKTGSATVTVSQKLGSVTVAISGSSAPVFAQTFGPPISFSATVGGTANTSVVWQVNGVTGGSAKTGTISTAGVYTPPHAVPVSTAPNTDGQTIDVIVTAISVADTTASDSADVVITPPQQNPQTLPIELGVSGSNAKDTSKIGGQTFCCGGTLGAVLTREGQNYILSNNHVLALEDLGVAASGNSGDAILQPGLIDNSCSASGASTVANLSQFYNLENGTGTPADAAIALVVNGNVDPAGTILQLGGSTNGNQPTDGPPHAGSGLPPSIGESVAKSGRSTGLTCASVTATHVSTTVEYQKGCGMGATFTVHYNDAITIGDGTFSAEGDSGSLVVDTGTADGVGLLFAGSDTDSVANPIADVLAQMADPATQARPTILGSASTHPVAACSLPGPQAAIAASLAVTRKSLLASALFQAAQARDAYSEDLLALPGVIAVGLGNSFDNPDEAAVLLFVSKGQSTANLPQQIEGVRTRILETDAPLKRAALSYEESAAAEQLASAAPLAVQKISAAESARALHVQRAHAADLLKQPGVQGVGITSSADSVGEAALMIFVVRGIAHAAIPPVIDGLRTHVHESTRFRSGRSQLHSQPGAAPSFCALPAGPAPANIARRRFL